MTGIFHRHALAEQMSAQLLRPGPLDRALRSGLFLSGVRRTGKTTFLRQDLIPALEAAGAIVIYVDLWSDTSVPPSALLHRAVRGKLGELQDPLSAAFSVLRKVLSAEVAAHGFRFKFDLSTLGEEGGPTLAEAFTEVVRQACADLVLIVDEVQQTLASEDGLSMMLALKAARDAINLSPNPPGHFLFIGTGSNRALVQELSARRNMAFQGAQSLPYPLLGDDFVSDLLKRVAMPPKRSLPSDAVAAQAFKDLGSRPEELLGALRVLAHSPAGASDPDLALQIIVDTIRSGLASAELVRIQDIGALAEVIFARIAASPETETRGLYSAEAAEYYSRGMGRKVRTEEIQSVVKQMQAANIIMRLTHGAYTVVDPFVREMWLERSARLE